MKGRGLLEIDTILGKKLWKSSLPDIITPCYTRIATRNSKQFKTIVFKVEHTSNHTLIMHNICQLSEHQHFLAMEEILSSLIGS